MAWQEIVSQKVPTGLVFRFHKFGVGWQTGLSGYAHFRVTKDGEPIGEGLGDFTHQAGALNISEMFPVERTIVGPAEVKIEGNLVGMAVPGSYELYARIIGYLGKDR